MKIQTSELTGPALDWAVAKCEGPNSVASCYYDDDQPLWLEEAPANEWSPSIDWNQGGPIIEREKLTLEWTGEDWIGYIWHDGEYFAPTPLIAAMRCFVASRLGDEVDIPDALLG